MNKKKLKNYAELIEHAQQATRRKGEADLAISIYKKVIKLNSESGASYYNRGMQYLTKNEFDKACNDFHAAQRAGIDQASFAIKKYCEFD